MKLKREPIFAAMALLTTAAFVRTAAALPERAQGAEVADGVMVLPDMIVNSGRLEDYPLIPKADLRGGGLSPSEPPVYMMYPGKAYAEGVPKGFATVCVELDTEGKATDFLLIAYTEKYFGQALLEEAKATKYIPKLYKGVAIPSRFVFGYEFRPEFTVPMSSFDAIERRHLMIRGGLPEFKLYPVTEAVLDSRLERVREAVPHFPAGYVPTGGKEDWVMVTLYIDEEGRVRVPQVESASSPLLVGNALQAVHYWRFKPPTMKGKPVLVYAAFAVNFTPAPIN